ncbi:recombinase family protein [bacterium]|nr:recombinase family protein [bacterium]
MQIFQNEEFGCVRTFVTEDGVPWFVGKDVADNLGYQNGSRDINRHVAPEDRTKGMVFDGNQRKESILINESGLYSLILSSKLESAKRFKHWVTGEVLPSIRRHGAYMTDALLEQAAGNADVAAQVVRALSEERNLNKKLAGQLKQAEAQLTVALPKAAYFDALVDCPDCTGIRLTAKELGVPQSIANQRTLLYRFIRARREFDGYEVDEFIDDGYSGTNGNRPSFERMIESLKKGEANVVICKDFSRFFRDYVEIGDYLERIFPFLGVRFIAVNDGYDSDDYKGSTAGMEVVMKYIVYSYYSRDLSQKIKTVMSTRKSKGEFVAAQPPYGYMKDPDVKRKIIPNPDGCVLSVVD